MNTFLPGCRTAVALLGLLAMIPATGEDPPGVLWESTSRMEMAGMPMSMPARTMKLCAAREWTRPPPGGDPSCTTSNFAVNGEKVSWDIQCGGEMEMSGVGEITFDGPDTYAGSIRLSGQGTNMTITLSGKKIGACTNPQ